MFFAKRIASRHAVGLLRSQVFITERYPPFRLKKVIAFEAAQGKRPPFFVARNINLPSGGSKNRSGSSDRSGNFDRIVAFCLRAAAGSIFLYLEVLRADGLGVFPAKIYMMSRRLAVRHVYVAAIAVRKDAPGEYQVMIGTIAAFPRPFTFVWDSSGHKPQNTKPVSLPRIGNREGAFYFLRNAD